MTLFESIDRNLRLGRRAYVQVLHQAKFQVKNHRPVEVSISEKVAALLLAAEYETRLNWLILHPNSRLSASEKQTIRNAKGTADKWDRLLRTALAERHRSVHGGDCTWVDVPGILGLAEQQQYFTIRRTTRTHMRSLIDLRNSLAHGEWSTALTRKADGINLDRTSSMRRMSLYRVVVLANLLDHLWKLHFDALVTRTAFERDFSKHYNGVLNAHTRLRTGDELAWLSTIERRYKSGRASRGERITP
ncbi:hypothetical protein [Arthrobacter sp. NPDC056727]|uniref:hypothetical protein n=1 Tax=Arthrobacter sp. NPDC056727 TaxID=3345927 RepID=UPI00366B2D6C